VQAIFDKTPPVPAPPDRYISSAPEIHEFIYGVLMDAANIRKLLLVPDKPNSRESQRRFSLRRYRAAFLRSALKTVVLQEILDQKVRNTLEHFDEYMDEAVLELSDSTTRVSPWAAFNLIVSGRDVFRPPIFPIKLYVADERVFYNLN
jgi:hypothetical protein